MAVVDIEHIWRLIYRGALGAGSCDPQEAAQQVLFRLYEKGLDPLQVELTGRPTIYWYSAGRNEAISQWRQQRPLIFLGSCDHFKDRFDMEEQIEDRAALADVPQRIVNIADRLSPGGAWDASVTRAERTYLCRWRAKQRAA